MTDVMTSAPSRRLLGPALAGFCGMLVGVGLGRFGYPPLIPVMVEAGWASPTALRLAGAFNLAGYVVGAVSAIGFARWLGLRRAALVAAVLSVLAFALSAVPLPEWAFIGLRAVSGMTGGIFMIVVPPVIASVVAPSHRGRAGGITFAGVGIGFVLSGIAVPLLAGSGPAGAWLGLAAVLTLASSVMMILLPRSPPPEAPQASAAAASVAWRRSAPFLGLAAAYGGASIGYVPHTLFFVDHVARDLGYGLAAGGWIWIASGATAVAAPLVAGVAADRFGYAAALRIVVALMAVGAALPALTSNFALLMLSGMLCGGLMIGLGSLTAGRTREIVGAGAHTEAWALQTILFAVLQTLGAYGFTALLATTGSHELVFAAAGGILAAGLAIELLASQLGRSAPTQP
ncbi:YbfB/YjiJ family MFS transporter [Phreatobacter stygius]|nr:YbfB/YjiJ family MFS transporter [Phreatobacter stygius]